MQAKSGFEMCFDIGSRHLGRWAKTRLEFRINKFTPRCVCRPKIGIDGGWQPAVVEKVTDNRGVAGATHPPVLAADAAGATRGAGVPSPNTAGSTGATGATGTTGTPPARAPTPAQRAKLQLLPEHERLGGDIEFDDVAFKYGGMDKHMLHGVTFKIEAGSFVGVCGERGASGSHLDLIRAPCCYVLYGVTYIDLVSLW